MRLEPKKRNSLVRTARKAARSAYAPYSKFRVGAVALANGKVYTGANVENSSYGLTICAERVAIFKAISDGAKNISALAVSCIDASKSSSASSRMPCGACRQVIAEFASRSFLAMVDGVGEFTLEEILPNSFDLR